MLQKLLRLRYIFLVAVAFTLLNSLCFLILGIREAFEGYKAIYQNFMGHKTEGASLYFLGSLDFFLIALVFLIFSLGMLKIFIHYNNDNVNLPRWLHIEDFKHLKILLWETILITLVVFTVGRVADHRETLGWEDLILPLIILILSIGLFLTRKE